VAKSEFWPLRVADGNDGSPNNQNLLKPPWKRKSEKPEQKSGWLTTIPAKGDLTEPEIKSAGGSITTKGRHRYKFIRRNV